MSFDPNEHQHNRYNPLKDEWVLVSPHRMLRPWSGQVENAPTDKTPSFDPNNPLCPGVERPCGIKTPEYDSVYVFKNDYPALLEDSPSPNDNNDDLFKSVSAKGTCRVICFHPKSDMHLGTMRNEEILDVINEWVKQTEDLGKKYVWVQIFENRGAIMGCSNPHPHCQVWASNFLPNEPRIKDKNLKEYYQKNGRPLLIDYVKKELDKQERIVYENDEFVVLVPYWAFWPFETMVLPKKQVLRITDLNETQKNCLADVLKVLVSKYDNVFKCSFPYSMGFHGAPTGDEYKRNQDHWSFHAMFYPPLLRSATVKKFMVGYEMFAQVQRDLTPEKAAKVLRDQNNIHYKMN
nr:probable galactose-1-phosphate uridylyltransferase [Onthophagus taurus]